MRAGKQFFVFSGMIAAALFAGCGQTQNHTSAEFNSDLNTLMAKENQLQSVGVSLQGSNSAIQLIQTQAMVDNGQKQAIMKDYITVSQNFIDKYGMNDNIDGQKISSSNYNGYNNYNNNTGYNNNYTYQNQYYPSYNNYTNYNGYNYNGYNNGTNYNNSYNNGSYASIIQSVRTKHDLVENHYNSMY